MELMQYLAARCVKKISLSPQELAHLPLWNRPCAHQYRREIAGSVVAASSHRKGHKHGQPCTLALNDAIHPPPPSPGQGASVVANRVLRLYAEEEGLDIDGLLPRNLDFCHSYLMVLAWEHEWEQALSFFWQLVERGRPHPDPNCYNAVLYGLNKAERWEETARVMDNFRSQQRNLQFAPDARPTRSLYLSALSPLLKVVSLGYVVGSWSWLVLTFFVVISHRLCCLEWRTGRTLETRQDYVARRRRNDSSCEDNRKQS